MTETLKDKTIRGLAWNFIDKFGTQVVYLVSGVFLARLLDQGDYGLIGMLAMFIALSNVLLDSGFGGALIRKQNAVQADFNAVFYFNVFTAVLLYILLYFCAPFIARFFNEPQLVPLTRVLSLSILFNSLYLIQTVILTRKLQMNRLTLINFAAMVASSGIAVLLAVIGYGVWALVLQMVLLAFFKSILYWIFNSWRPSLGFNLKPLREAVSFSSRMLLSGIINVVFNNIYSVIIGKTYQKMELGYYQQANKFQDIPVSVISNTFRTVVLPVFSNVNTDEERLRRVLEKINQSIACVIFPVIFGLVVIAEPLLVGLIGEKWLPSVDIFRILLLAGLFSAFTQVFGELFIAKGRSGTYLRVEIIKKIILVLAIFITHRYGVKGLAAGWVVYSFLSMLISGYYTCRLIRYPLFRFFRTLLPYFLLALAMTGFVFAFFLIPVNIYIRMGLQVIAGASFYMGGCVLFKLGIAREVMDLIRKKAQK